MPKLISEEEMQNMRDFMYKKGIELIQKKGVRKVTVDDITQSIGMAKGSFYRYYPSKEEYLYQVLKRNEKESFDKMMSISVNEADLRKQIIEVFSLCFMGEDSLFLYTNPSDLDYLLIKLPREYSEKEKLKSENNFMAFTKLLKLKPTEENYGTLSCLMDALWSIMQNTVLNQDMVKSRAIHILIEGIAEFFMEERDETIS